MKNNAISNPLEIIMRNALGNDKTLLTDGNEDDYWYSVSDGIALALYKRKTLLTYYKDNKAANDRYSSLHENTERIYLSNPYHILNLKEGFEDDIKIITGTHESNINLMWQNMPSTLIVPLLIEDHWNCIRIKVYYDKNKASILFDDPKGASESKGLYNKIAEWIRPSIQTLIQKENNIQDFILKTNDLALFFKDIKQQSFWNGWDCGPIIFNNISCYIQNNSLVNKKFVSDETHFAIKSVGKNDKIIREIREADIISYKKVSEKNTKTLGSEISSNKKTIQQSIKSKIGTKSLEIHNKIAKLDSKWVIKFVDRLEKNNLDNAEYSEKDLKEAYYSIIEEKAKSERNRYNYIDSKSSNVDPFIWQINRHFSGVMKNIDQLDEKIMNSYLEQMKLEITRIENEAGFKELEDLVRRAIKKRLKEFIETNFLSEEKYQEELALCKEIEDTRISEYLERKQEIEDNPESAEWDYDGPDYGTPPNGYERPSYSDESDTYTSSSDSESSDSDSDNDNESEEEISRNEKAAKIKRKNSTDYENEFYFEENYSDEDEDIEQQKKESFENWKKEKLNEIGDLEDLNNLIKKCRGNKGLGWLINQIVEYEMDILEDILNKIDHHGLEIDQDIIDSIFYNTTMDRNYDDSKIQGGFIADAFIKNIDRLIASSGKIEEAKNPFLYSTKGNIMHSINSRVAKIKYLIENGELIRLQNDYNDAYKRNDMVSVNKCWAVFAKFQKLLISIDSEVKLKKGGKDYALKSKPTSYKDLLDKAYNMYKDRSEEYYHRIYPARDIESLIYSAKSYQKKASLNLEPILSELEIIGRAIKQKLIESNPKVKDDTTNVLVPVLYFVVSTKPHGNSDHQRIFIPIALRLSKYKSTLLSKDSVDEVFSENEEYFYEQIEKDHQYGQQFINYVNDKVRKTTANFSEVRKSNLLHHSERVLFEVLKDRNNVKEIINLFKIELQKHLGVDSLEEGKYKVYSLGLLAYSLNSVCELCTIGIVALQNSYYKGGFLNLLVSELNRSSDFKTRGYNADKNTQNFSKFRLSAIVISDKNFTPQSDDLVDDPINNKIKSPTSHHNPKGKLFFPSNTIDLYKAEIDKDGNATKGEKSFVELVKMERVHTRRSENDFQFYGKCFMSKTKKTGYKDSAKQIEERVKFLNVKD